MLEWMCPTFYRLLWRDRCIWQCEFTSEIHKSFLPDGYLGFRGIILSRLIRTAPSEQVSLTKVSYVTSARKKWRGLRKNFPETIDSRSWKKRTLHPSGKRTESWKMDRYQIWRISSQISVWIFVADRLIKHVRKKSTSWLPIEPLGVFYSKGSAMSRRGRFFASVRKISRDYVLVG